MIFGQHFLFMQDDESVGCCCYSLLSNYEGLNRKLGKKRQLLVNGDLESNPGPSQTLMMTKQNSQREITKSERNKCVIT